MRRNWSATATVIATLLVLLANVSGWASCRQYARSFRIGSSLSDNGCYSGASCNGSQGRKCDFQECACPSTYIDGSRVYYGGRVGGDYCPNSPTYSQGCEFTPSPPGKQYCDYEGYCASQTESDSVNCVNGGHQWDSGTHTCRTSSCTSSDTSWLKTSIAACQDIRGSNNYALVDTNDVCEHRGHCCALDSLIEGDSCKWRCESQDSLCALNKGNFSYAIVADTAVSGSDTTYTGLCYNNCFMYASRDSLTGLVTGNVTAVNNTSMAAGTYYPDGFKGIRSDYAGIYTYDFLSDETYEWADSLLSAPCSVGMYRGIKNGKYVYWKSGQPVPEGVTNVVKVK